MTDSWAVIAHCLGAPKMSPNSFLRPNTISYPRSQLDFFAGSRRDNAAQEEMLSFSQTGRYFLGLSFLCFEMEGCFSLSEILAYRERVLHAMPAASTVESAYPKSWPGCISRFGGAIKRENGGN